MAHVDSAMDNASPQSLLSDDESKVLDLYDRLQELRLECAIVNAQRYHHDGDGESGPEEAQVARDEMLEVRAKYMLRNQVIESVLIANPTLKAVHGGKDATLLETDLLPAVEKRDEIGISVAKHAADLAAVRAESSNIHGETIKVARRNISLAAQVLDLAAKVKAKKAGRPDDPAVLQELDKLDRDVKRSNQRWRIIKGVASGVVVGSGIDWSRDEHLCTIVLDPEEEP